VGGNTYIPEEVSSAPEYFSYVAEPSPYLSYYYYDVSTETYVPYEPTPVAWTDWYEPVTEEVYTFVPALDTYEVVEEPSPYLTYFTYVPSTHTYEELVPTVASWSSYYA
jgi:hypothetical protein